jgi:hypothetical protein
MAPNECGNPKWRWLMNVPTYNYYYYLGKMPEKVPE